MLLRSLKKVGLACGALMALSQPAHAGFMTFIDTASPTDFVVPSGVSSVRVLAIGGGGGGANGHQGGGGAGFLDWGSVSVTAGEIFSVIVGAGGNGAASGTNTIVGLTAGGTSSFSDLFTAAGGGVVSGINQGGHNGSSGGGAACNAGSLGGNGGSLGSNGQACQSGSSMPIGTGMGDYSSILSFFTQAVLSGGAGGAGGTGSHAGGGGAGGLLVNGLGISANNGAQSWSGQGGQGYGAGGGAGGLDFAVDSTRYAGGNGASGLVYVEWDEVISTPVSEPSALVLFLGGMGLIALRRKRR